MLTKVTLNNLDLGKSATKEWNFDLGNKRRNPIIERNNPVIKLV